MSKKIIFCGYRSWALQVFKRLKDSHATCNFYLAENMKQLDDLSNIPDIDVILLVGWSWILDKETVNNNIVVGVHPSDLPDYAGGSPIQNQIIDGIIETKSTLFRLNEKIDEGSIVYKTGLSLKGSIKDVFLSLENSSFKLLNDFLINFPDFPEIKQDKTGIKCRRIRPKQSQLTISKIKNMSTEDIYNFIRCREDPYPNVYIEDDLGKIFFKKVEFERK